MWAILDLMPILQIYFENLNIKKYYIGDWYSN